MEQATHQSNLVELCIGLSSSEGSSGSLLLGFQLESLNVSASFADRYLGLLECFTGADLWRRR